MAKLHAHKQWCWTNMGNQMDMDDDSPELSIPPEALEDPEAFEIMRLWAGGGHLHVAINSGLDGGAEDFGECWPTYMSTLRDSTRNETIEAWRSAAK
jgi:hypothetical protein